MNSKIFWILPGDSICDLFFFWMVIQRDLFFSGLIQVTSNDRGYSKATAMHTESPFITAPLRMASKVARPAAQLQTQRMDRSEEFEHLIAFGGGNSDIFGICTNRSLGFHDAI